MIRKPEIDMHVKKVMVVAAVIQREGKWLLCQRPTGKNFAGTWEFPGGKMEEGESAVEALRRELREELGLEVVAAGPPLATIQEDDGALEIIFVPIQVQGVPRLFEHSAIKWANWAEVLEASMPPLDRRFVSCFRPAVAD